MVMGDLVLLDAEVPAVMSGLFAGGLEVTAVHNHLNEMSPHVMYMHFAGHGDAVQMAKALRQALSASATPLGSAPAAPAAASGPLLDTKQIEQALGRQGRDIGGGVFQVTVARPEAITEMGRRCCPPWASRSMDALQALVSRVSPARLAPDELDPLMIEQILAAGLRAADHGRLRPWRFLVVRGEARHRLGELLAEGLKVRNPGATVEMLEAEHRKALRAPVIVIVLGVIQDNPNIPDIEQIVSAGAAAQNMLVAAHALGLGGFWRTGPAAYDPLLRKALGASEKDVTVGFLYLGKVATAGAEKAPDPEGVVVEWHG